jgi:CO dehydrogenase nickel-insertion accessory protein CooC1
MQSLEQRLQALNDLDLVRFALKYRKTMPEEHAAILEEVIKDRISPDRWSRLCEELARDSSFQAELKKAASARLQDREGKKNESMVVVCTGRLSHFGPGCVCSSALFQVIITRGFPAIYLSTLSFPK